MSLSANLSTGAQEEAVEDEVLKELEFHIEQRAAHLVEAGISQDEAQRRARLEFGGVAQVREACDDVRRWRVFDELRDDLRFAIRLARRTPAPCASGYQVPL